MTGRAQVGLDLAAGLTALLAVAGVTQRQLDLPAAYLLQSAALYALLAAGVAHAAPADLPGRGLGAANRVTLARAALVLSLAPLALHVRRPDTAAHWWIIAVSTVALVLDGVDGRVARRTGGATAFGARFDMELDAFLMLALSALVWSSGRVGPWVLAIGSIRYLFAAAGRLWPPLRAALPDSFRRKAICVVQGIALLVCLGPIVPPAGAAAAAATALGLLVYSFAVDVRWLVRRAGGPGGGGGLIG